MTMDDRTAGPDWSGPVRGPDFWSEILFGPVRGPDFCPDFYLVRYVVRILVRIFLGPMTRRLRNVTLLRKVVFLNVDDSRVADNFHQEIFETCRIR